MRSSATSSGIGSVSIRRIRHVERQQPGAIREVVQAEPIVLKAEHKRTGRNAAGDLTLKPVIQSHTSGVPRGTDPRSPPSIDHRPTPQRSDRAGRHGGDPITNGEPCLHQRAKRPEPDHVVHRFHFQQGDEQQALNRGRSQKRRLRPLFVPVLAAPAATWRSAPRSPASMRPHDGAEAREASVQPSNRDRTVSGKDIRARRTPARRQSRRDPTVCICAR